MSAKRPMPCARIDWKYAFGLERTDPGLHFSVLRELCTRLAAGQAEHVLLDTLVERFKQRGLLKVGGKQRTDSTHVLAGMYDLNLLERVAETRRAVLNDLAAIVPDWLCALAKPDWFERYGRRVEQYQLPKSQNKRVALAQQIGADGFFLLEAFQRPATPAIARDLRMVQTLRAV